MSLQKIWMSLSLESLAWRLIAAVGSQWPQKSLKQQWNLLLPFLVPKDYFWRLYPLHLDFLNHSTTHSETATQPVPNHPNKQNQIQKFCVTFFLGKHETHCSSSQRINQWLTEVMITPKVQLGENLSLLILLPGQVLHDLSSWGNMKHITAHPRE